MMNDLMVVFTSGILDPYVLLALVLALFAVMSLIERRSYRAIKTITGEIEELKELMKRRRRVRKPKPVSAVPMQLPGQVQTLAMKQFTADQGTDANGQPNPPAATMAVEYDPTVPKPKANAKTMAVETPEVKTADWPLTEPAVAQEEKPVHPKPAPKGTRKSSAARKPKAKAS